MRVKQLLCVSMVMTALSACTEQEARFSPNTPNSKTPAAATPNVQPAQAVIANASAPASNPSNINTIAPLSASTVTFQTVNGRQMVVSADLNFETGNVQKTSMQVEELAKRHSGYVVFSQIETYPNGTQSYPKPDGNTLNITRYSHEGSMTVRIPREKSSDFLKDIQQVIDFLEHQEFKAEDVSLSLRKQVLEAQRQQELNAKLDEFKRNQQARHPLQQTEESIRAEFEAKARENDAQLQRDFWEDKMSLATITLRFRQPEGVLQELTPNLDAIAKQHRPNVGIMAWNGIKQGWDYILVSLIFLLGYWPITLGIPAIWLGMKIARKIRSRRLTRKLTEAVKTSRRRQYADEEIDDFD